MWIPCRQSRHLRSLGLFHRRDHHRLPGLDHRHDRRLDLDLDLDRRWMTHHCRQQVQRR